MSVRDLKDKHLANLIRRGKREKSELKEKLKVGVRHAIRTTNFTTIHLGELCAASHGAEDLPNRLALLEYCEYHINRFTQKLLDNDLYHNGTCPYHNAVVETEREAVSMFIRVLKSMKRDLEGKDE